MTALSSEISGAEAEGVEMVTLMAPARVNADGDGNVTGLVVQPQIPGDYSRGRPAPVNADAPEVELPCDVVVAAIGQAIDFGNFVECGIPEHLGKFQTESSGAVAGKNGIYAGGDCASGPATVIMAIQAGKIAAANLDEYFGYHSEISEEIEIPQAEFKFKDACGRCNMRDRPPLERVKITFYFITFPHRKSTGGPERCLENFFPKFLHRIFQEITKILLQCRAFNSIIKRQP